MKLFLLSHKACYFIFGVLLFTSFSCTDRSHRTTDDFDSEKKDLAVTIDSQIENLNNNLEMLRDKANEAGENVSAEFRVQLSELEEERQRLQAHKETIENTPEEEWLELKNEVQQDLEVIEKNIDQEVERLNSLLQD